ncbi:hypothetical protein ASF32_08860 [Methylobacterium sp. Leaf91]|nr:hypothetical protein ASF24_12130 [Methylobacterium sp. Leaf86]KQO85799.1 hypothetical protein ASF32_08860 [Methylobacterium sp. Leaf91]
MKEAVADHRGGLFHVRTILSVRIGPMLALWSIAKSRDERRRAFEGCSVKKQERTIAERA